MHTNLSFAPGACPLDSSPGGVTLSVKNCAAVKCHGCAEEAPTLWREAQDTLLALRGCPAEQRLALADQLEKSLTQLRWCHSELTDYVENANIGLHWVGTDGRILWANQAQLDMLGYSREEYVGQQIAPFHIDQSVIQCLLAALTNGKKPHGVSAQLRAKDGSTKHVLINTSMLVVDGQPLHTRCFLLDVTEAKRLEAENAQLRSALDSALDGVALLEGDRVRYLNHAQAQMLGFDRPEELIGSSWRDLYEPTEQARLTRDAFPVLRHQGHWRGITRARRRDGSSFVKRLSLKHLSNGNVISVSSDVTELEETRKRLEAAHAELATRSEQLQEANAQLVVAARMKDEFLANMSHELRTPLTAMLGMTDVLREQLHGPLLPPQQRSVEVIASSSKHLLGLINDILDLAKVEARMLALEREPIAVSTACLDAVEIVQPLAEAKRVELTFQIAPDVATLHADARRLRQILLNLLGNAVKFTPAKGEVRLTVRAEDAGRTVRFDVIDTGIGIPPEALKDLFQPFKQLHSELTRHHEGTGLGLALARRLAELHGGRITVASTVGQGSCFSCFLPCGENPPPPEHPAPTPVASAPTVEALRLRVLLVDNNEMNLEALTEYLSAKRWIVTSARSGLEAIAQLSAADFDLVLMDIHMPGMDGYETIRRIRSLPQSEALPIIAVTALAMADDREKCLAAGANHYLSKPIGLGKLNDEMHQLLTRLKP